MNVISAICFVGFVALGLAVACNRSRSLTNLFIAYVVLVSFAAGLSQRDMWPFSSWTMFVGLTPPATRTIPTLRIAGLDGTGGEHDIDYRAWQPLSLEELQSWMNRDFFTMDRPAQDRVGAFFLGEANRAREQALAPSGLSYPNRLLGRFTAPTHVLHPAIWSHAGAVPPSSFVVLRIYQESWNLELRATDAARVTRVLKYEYPQP